MSTIRAIPWIGGSLNQLPQFASPKRRDIASMQYDTSATQFAAGPVASAGDHDGLLRSNTQDDFNDHGDAIPMTCFHHLPLFFHGLPFRQAPSLPPSLARSVVDHLHRRYHSSIIYPRSTSGPFCSSSDHRSGERAGLRRGEDATKCSRSSND